MNAKASAEAQVAASVKKTARLKSEVAAYKEIAAASARGSREQVAAANLAAQAEGRLARSMGVTAHEARSLRSASSGFDRSFSQATRGALAGSGIFQTLGRSIAFASGGFLAFATVGQFIRTSIDAAIEAQTVQKQLAAQFRASGKDVRQYEAAIDSTANRLALLAGFENDEVKAAFTTIFRTTGDVSKSLRDTATAADLARAKHLGLNQAALIVAKTEAGNTTLLRRQGIQIKKNATAEEALAKLRQVVAGQAKAGTTEQERFGAVLHNTEEIIGTGILPVLNQYLGRSAVWLTQMNESGKLQKDVATAAHAVGTAVDFMATSIGAATSVIRAIDRVTGSFKNTLESLAGVRFSLPIAKGLFNDAKSIFGLGSKPKVGGDFAAGSTIAGGGDVGPGFITIGADIEARLAKRAAAQGSRATTLQGRFNLAELRLARAQLTATLADDRKILETEAAITREQIAQSKTLKARTQLTSQLAGILSQIRGIDHDAAQAAKDAARKRAEKRAAAAAKLAAGGVPLSLQLAEAKADAAAAGRTTDGLTSGQVAARKAIRDAELRAIHSHKLSMQGLIDAWNEIAQINSELQSQTGKGMIATYHHASTKALTAGMGLTRDQAIAIRERAAQLNAHRGYVPSGPAALGQPVGGVTIHGNVNVHGVRNIDQLASELEKVARKKTRRGHR